MTKRFGSIHRIASSTVLPSGELLQLGVDQLMPSRDNPRVLFDDPALQSLKKSIEEHGVLVPLTVYRPKGQERFAILDGERRFRCCRLLADEKPELAIRIPANVVRPPTKVAGLLYMFSIHNFREQWELLPTALSLQTVMNELGEKDDVELERLTGLSSAQIKRCKILLSFPQKYKDMSLDPEPSSRIPSNFWIELYPVLEIVEKEIPKLHKKIGRDGVTDRLVEKYRDGKIRSVIHFRRITEAYELANQNKKAVLDQLEEYILDTNIETRAAFDHLVDEQRRVAEALDACDGFLKKLGQLKLEKVVEKGQLEERLAAVSKFIKRLATDLSGSDDPDVRRRK